VLGARRDGSAGVDSSRDLLMTVLGEFVLPLGEAAWTQTLIALLERLGVRDKAARQALARMRERGLLARQPVGRRTRWMLTDHARDLLEAGSERIYGFGRQDRQWDGTWVLLLASVPERERHVRYRMGLGLTWSGFGSIGQGIWLSPWPQQEEAAVDLLDELGVEATSFRATLGSLGSGRRLAESAWDLPELRGQYEHFLVETRANDVGAMPDGEQAAELAALVHRWRRFPLLDPDLPTELLPADWSGAVAAQRFAERRDELLPGAHRWWRAMETELTPT
jgi:phenylacetic acid degradation operon negative regulatory protein